MAGLIRSEDIAAVKERASIEDVVREHVTLRQAGLGALKGLCPFHDERTPSFNVRPAVGAWHCFGCNEGGDVISFVQKIDHLSFTEAVERLAARAGVELRYEEGEGPRRESLGRRQRLVEAHRAAAELYAEALLRSPDARPARDFLRAKGFDSRAATLFQVGYAPRTGEALVAHLTSRGFTADELTTAGLAGQGSRGLYDRFRGRVVWPIRDITGDTIGFGARRLFDDDRIAAKYLNTSETPIYRKTSVLYGLDLAKKAMARDRRAVVVEGYTDVMACHLAGVENAVATCGTAFGADHIKALRRILRDEAGQAPARVIFTFDGDAAGQKAAMRAFADDHRWASQSFVAVADAGQDPNDLRQSRGDAAVRGLIEDAVPMFEFAVRTTLARFDLDTPEGRVQAMRAVAPIIASIRDRALRPEYTRTVAGWIGIDGNALSQEVASAPKVVVDDARPCAEPGAGGSRGGSGEGEPLQGQGQAPAAALLPRPDLRDPAQVVEHHLLQAALQYPSTVVAAGWAQAQLGPDAFTAPAHRLVAEAIAAAGGPQAGASMPGTAWARTVHDEAVRREQERSGEVAVAEAVLSELVVAPIPTRVDPATGRPHQRYVDDLVARIRETGLNRRIADAMSRLQRLDPGDQESSRALGVQLQEWQRELQTIKASR